MGGRRFSFSVLSMLFVLEALYGFWSIRVWDTLGVMVGENLDISFFSELLISYDFEKEDFVYEAGQFAVRGGGELVRVSFGQR